MFDFLKKAYRKNKQKRLKQDCLIIPLLSKSDLVDGEEYMIVQKTKYFGNLISYGYWDSDCNAFLRGAGRQEISCLYRDADKIFKESDIKNGKVFQYNPSRLTELDLAELSDICFNANDNTTSEEIWENLIRYFEERGIYPKDAD